MSSGGTSFGTNTAAQRKRVMYFGTSVIYEGMPVCYDNSTTNVLGYDPYSSTASTTTTEGYQNEGKFLRVENPNADNVGLFAGVVAHGPKVGTTGVATGVWLDIFIPNGAVVPVRTDQNCLADNTILAITTGSQELGASVTTDTRSVAIARETIDRGTAGLVLAELCPDRFIYQDQGGTALTVDDASTGTDSVVNRININFLQATGNCTALWVQSSLTIGGAANGYGLAGYFEADISAVASSHVAGTGIWLNVTAGVQTKNLTALEVGYYSSGANLTGAGSYTVPLVLRTDISSTNGPAANHHYMTYYVCNGTDKPDGLFMTYTPDSIGMAAKSGTCAISHVIPIHVQVSGGGITAGTYYIMVTNEA